MASVLFGGNESKYITGGMGTMYINEPEKGRGAALRTEATGIPISCESVHGSL